MKRSNTDVYTTSLNLDVFHKMDPPQTCPGTEEIMKNLALAYRESVYFKLYYYCCNVGI